MILDVFRCSQLFSNVFSSAAIFMHNHPCADILSQDDVRCSRNVFRCSRDVFRCSQQRMILNGFEKTFSKKREWHARPPPFMANAIKISIFLWEYFSHTKFYMQTSNCIGPFLDY